MVEKRRPKGSGSIYTLKDGSVVGRYEVDTLKGKKRKYIRSKTKREVASKLARAIADRDSGLVYDSGNLTVGQYLDTFLDTEKDSVGYRHWRRHEELVRLHIKPAIASVKLDRLSPLHLQSLYRSKLNGGLSPKTVRKIHACLSKALRQAVRWQLILKAVTEAVDPPRVPRAEINVLTVEQVKGLLKAAEGEKLCALYVLAATTALREGELLALKKQDVDLQAGTLQVRRTVYSGVVSAPKTGA